MEGVDGATFGTCTRDWDVQKIEGSRNCDSTLLYGKLSKRVRQTKSCAVIGIPSGRDGTILTALDYPLCPERN